ncbi:cephalosporin hydroxylase family protein [Luminiphilus sp.]|nr:cephalosporin hydroxylase family protein [Luminiphilus sp.]
MRSHNQRALDNHPMSRSIRMIQGSSIDADIIRQVHDIASAYKNILVCLDSNHTHEHVLAELEAYAGLVTAGSYCVVFDTVIDDMPADTFSNRPWGPGNNPKTAAKEFLKNHVEFEIDKSVQNRYLITAAPDGFLRRVSV